MSAKDIDTASKIHENISEKIESVIFNSIRKVLPDKAIEDACDVVGYRHRRRVITPIVTILHMILAAIWPEESFAASWQVLWASFSSRFGNNAGKSPSLGSVAKARARLPLSLWDTLFEWTSQQGQLLSEKHDKWRGLRVILLDGMCVSMSDTQDLLNTFGTNTGHNNNRGKYPLARMVTLCLANTMTVLSYKLGRYQEDENSLARPLLDNLGKGDLLLADRHFAASHYYAYYMATGFEFLTRVHHCLKMSRIKRIVSYSGNDFLGWLKINPVYQRRNPSLPEKVMVRFTQAGFMMRGQLKRVWFVSSLLDQTLYPADEIVHLYAKRWRIETLFKTVKINFGADILRSLSASGIRKEIASRIIAVNIVRTIMLESAIDRGVDPIRISFVHAVRAILMFAPSLATEPIWRLQGIYYAMLYEIASHVVPERTGRNEPRSVRRERIHYPSLKTTRQQWRKAYVA